MVMKTALITGCSSGYGRATAEHFHQQGWNLIATMRAPARRQAGVLPESDRLRVLPLDVTDRASIASAIGAGIEAFGAIDVLVNNAGIGMLSAFEATPEATTREIFETNVFGVMAVTQAAIPHLRERRAGTIVNVTSSVAIAPMPMVAVYAASKTAIEGFTESLSYELAGFNVGVKIVQPGYGPATSFTANGSARMNGLIPPAYGRYLEQLMGNLASAKTTAGSDVARAVWLAATDGTRRLRYPAGPDAEDLAAMRRALPGDDYLDQMRGAMAPKG
jgi:NAD(P)-dependent dehydrogenase (short-subunit alcohol dehydrogenase family)